MQELLPDTLSKCMEETNSWGPSIHADIMECCSALMAALAARLGVLGAGLEADEGDLVPLLQSATAAVDATCMFHKQHKLDRLPDRLDALHAEDWAASRDEGEELVVRGLSNPNKSLRPGKVCLAHCHDARQARTRLHARGAAWPTCLPWLTRRRTRPCGRDRHHTGGVAGRALCAVPCPPLPVAHLPHQHRRQHRSTGGHHDGASRCRLSLS